MVEMVQFQNSKGEIINVKGDTVGTKSSPYVVVKADDFLGSTDFRKGLIVGSKVVVEILEKRLNNMIVDDVRNLTRADLNDLIVGIQETLAEAEGE